MVVKKRPKKCLKSQKVSTGDVRNFLLKNRLLFIGWIGNCGDTSANYIRGSWLENKNSTAQLCTGI